MKWLQKLLDKLLLDKSTLELQELNILWERFNKGEDVEFEVTSREWRYHESKARLLLQLHDLRR